MLRFRFQLRAIEDIPPWGGETPTLHWFGLTDGWFWIETGDQELFRYSDTIIHTWNQKADALPDESCFGELPFEDYYIARYFEDLIDLLHAVLDPLPDDLAALVSDDARWNSWLTKANLWYEKHNDDDDTQWGIYYTATGWWSSRRWSASHLNYPPRIWLWRHHDTIFLRWDNRTILAEGIPVWSAADGQIMLSLPEFIDAVQLFHDTFLVAMQKRIDILSASNPRSDVTIDLPGVEHNHNYHTELLPNVLIKRPREIYFGITWDEVRAAIQTIEYDLAP